MFARSILSAFPGTRWTRRLVVLGGLACSLGLMRLAALGARGRLADAETLPDIIRAVAPASPAVSLEVPLRLLLEAQRQFADVRDYACVFVKRERLRGEVQPENVIALKVRHEPFSVHMRWLGPKDFAGQEACFVAGRHQGKMRARSAGMLGALGFVSLAPRDARVLAHNRHDITEAGIGHLIERLLVRWEAECPLSQTQVRSCGQGRGNSGKRRA